MATESQIRDAAAAGMRLVTAVRLVLQSIDYFSGCPAYFLRQLVDLKRARDHLVRQPDDILPTYTSVSFVQQIGGIDGSNSLEVVLRLAGDLFYEVNQCRGSTRQILGHLRPLAGERSCFRHHLFGLLKDKLARDRNNLPLCTQTRQFSAAIEQETDRVLRSIIPLGETKELIFQNRKKPSEKAMVVYRYWFGSNVLLSDRKTQTELAEDPKLMKLLGRTVVQGTISKYLKEVSAWIEAGNVLPGLTASGDTKQIPMDPERIDLGKRVDGRKHKGSRDSNRDD
jgi:hypothetical protein